MLPLRFTPLFRRYVWGGRSLATRFNKPIGVESCAESWEIVDHDADQSVVAYGPFQGKSLHDLVVEQGPALMGRHHPQRRFPLLLKLIDAAQNLSVQVHPDDARAAQLTPPDLGKTEAWVVLHAEPDSLIYAGLKRGFDRHAFERELSRGAAELCLHKFQPKIGDCVFLPAGAVHALGAGLVIAEIQQASDTTYRLYDWNRLGTDGRPRPLHLEQGLDAIDYRLGPIAPQLESATAHAGVTNLVTCDKFILDRHALTAAAQIGGDERCHILLVLSGAIELPGDPANKPLLAGEALLLPAAAGTSAIRPLSETVLLDAYLP